MADYDIFAKFYDAVLGQREEVATKVSSLIKEYHPEAETILELAAGTGTNLVPLSEKYEVHGLDLSEEMLKVAKGKLPNTHFYRQDMVTFNIPKKFDVILCLFDSINHLLDFKQWEQMFENVRRHLNKNGVFIFDVNTPEKLQRVANGEPLVKQFDGNRMEMTVRAEEGGITDWSVKLQESGSSVVQEENIKEIAFPTDKIKDALEKVFSSVDITSEARSDTGVIERVYFGCKK